jgi:hypothetical protein
MPARRRTVTLSLEREVVGPTGTPERLRLSARFDPEDGSAEGPTLEELKAGLERLREEMLGLSGGSRYGALPPRGLDELVETYRPRQEELVALLEEEGEVSTAEAELMRGYLTQRGASSAATRAGAPDLPPIHERPLAAAPLEHDRTGPVPRPVARLLEEYRIETLKQAGAVRARRQISFEEYMSLKRHFSASEAPKPPVPPAPVRSEPHPSHSG